MLWRLGTRHVLHERRVRCLCALIVDSSRLSEYAAVIRCRLATVRGRRGGDDMTDHRLAPVTRRRFLGLMSGVASLGLAAACGQPAPPAATTAPAKPAEAAKPAAPAAAAPAAAPTQAAPAVSKPADAAKPGTAAARPQGNQPDELVLTWGTFQLQEKRLDPQTHVGT